MYDCVRMKILRPSSIAILAAAVAEGNCAIVTDGDVLVCKKSSISYRVASVCDVRTRLRVRQMVTAAN